MPIWNGRDGWDRRARPTIERFLEKIEPEPNSGCWLWLASGNSEGYGRFTDDFRRRVLAYRWAYETFRGLVPDGLELDHLCRVRLCANPFHLEPVTGLVNARRSPLHLTNRTACILGHPYNAENTRWGRRRGRRYRRCATCRAIKRGAVDPGYGRILVMSMRAAPRIIATHHLSAS